jgi:hypothetical protein
MIWTILGVSVAILAVFCVTVSELLVGHPIFERYRGYIALTLIIGGIVAWFMGRFLGRRRRASNPEEEAKVFLLFDLRYWGPMLVTLGTITLFILTLRLQSVKAAVAARPPPPKKVEVVAIPEPPPQPKAPVVFPALHLQGIFLREGRAAAIINGRSYSVGDTVGEVTVKEINRNGVALEKLGEVKLVSLR